MTQSTVNVNKFLDLIEIVDKYIKSNGERFRSNRTLHYDYSDELTEEKVLEYCEDSERIEKVVIEKMNGYNYVSVKGDFTFNDNIEILPFRFKCVDGYFSCKGLKYFEGLPIYSKGITIEDSKVINLMSLSNYYNHMIAGSISFNGCSIDSLKGLDEMELSKEIKRALNIDLYFNRCSINHLIGCPKEVANLTFYECDIKEFDNGPEEVKHLELSSCKGFENCKGLPSDCESVTLIYNKYLTSLDGFPKNARRALVYGNGNNFTYDDVKDCCRRLFFMSRKEYEKRIENFKR